MRIDVTKKEIEITLTMNEREAQLLACLIGAMSPSDVQVYMEKASLFPDWVREVGISEISVFTSNIYDGLYDTLSDF